MKTEKITEWLVVASVALVPLIFWRGVAEAFDLTKATVLWVIALLLLSTLILRSREVVVWRGTKSTSFVLFAIALLISTAVAPGPWYGIYGQPYRFTGLLTYLSCLLICWIISESGGVALSERIQRILCLSALPISVYALIQSAGNDPFEWTTTSFGVPVFSTIGNPNTASGFLSCLIPFIVLNLFDLRLARFWRVAASSLLGLTASTIGLFSSFQGNAVTLVCGLFMFVSVLRSEPRSGLQLVGESALAAIVVSSSFVVDSSAQCLAFGILGGLAGFCCTSSRFDSIWPPSMKPSRRSALVMGVGGVVLLVVVGWLGIRGANVGAQFADGFLERGDFYRAAWSVFVDHPILGGGLENFGLDFPGSRPEGHALRLEDSRTTSVHSVPLGWLSAGGMVLAGAAVFFIGVVTLRGILRIRSNRQTWSTSAFLLLAWICLLIQFSVSVEHVALLLLFFVTAGLILVQDSNWPDRVRARRRAHQSATVRSGLGAVAIGILVVGFMIIPRPFMASKQALDASKALYLEKNFGDAIDRQKSVVGWVPYDFLQRITLADMEYQSGMYEESADNAARAVRDANFVAPIALSAAVILAGAGRFDETRSVLLESVKHDPFAQQHRLRVANLLTQLGSALRDQGRFEESEQLFLDALAVSDSYEPARTALDGLPTSQP